MLQFTYSIARKSFFVSRVVWVAKAVPYGIFPDWGKVRSKRNFPERNTYISAGQFGQSTVPGVVG